MNETILITTAISETSSEENNVLYAGSWCFSYKKSEELKNKNLSVHSYHWDDRDKFYKDYIYVLKFIDEVVVNLSKCLNDFHNVNRDERYWKIILGPWLSFFIAAFFDRWSIIDEILEKRLATKTYILNKKFKPPETITEYFSFVNNDYWNHYLFSQIISHYKNIEIVKIPSNEGKKIKRNFSWKQLIFRLLNSLPNFSHNKKFFFSTYPYLRLRSRFKLEIVLKQFPSILFRHDVIRQKYNEELRNDLKRKFNSFESSNKFESCFYDLLSQFIPMAYLEGYCGNIEKISKIKWPKNPKVIFSANSHISDDFFKIWSAEMSCYGSKIYLIQHGGFYGIGKINLIEKIEKDIADKFLSWGWTDNKTIAISSPLLLGSKKRIKHSDFGNGCLSIINTSIPRYAYSFYTMPIAGQFIHELDNQIKFVKNLSQEIYSKTYLKLYPNDYGFCQKERWSDNLKDLNFYNDSESVLKIFKNSRLVIHTYNATTFLESLARNIPTILIIDINYWELRGSAKEQMKKLSDMGIVHYEPLSAAKYINKIWHNLEAWWLEDKRQKVIDGFCNEFAKNDKNWINTWISSMDIDNL